MENPVKIDDLGNPIKIDYLGVSLFLETSISSVTKVKFSCMFQGIVVIFKKHNNRFAEQPILKAAKKEQTCSEDDTFPAPERIINIINKS